MYINYSVLMSVYYKEKPVYLRQAIESMLNQSVSTDNFVLVCDGPLTSELNQVIQYFKRLRPEIFDIIQLQKNYGLGLALSIGIQKCRNELVARMDSDDIAQKDRCRQQLNFFNKHEDCDVLSGTIAEFENIEEEIVAYKMLPTTNNELYKYARYRCPVNHPCVMYKKKSVIASGNYQTFYHLEDYYLWIRMMQNKCNFYNLDSILLFMRMDTNAYKRRGGYGYMRSFIKLRIYMFKTGFLKPAQFVASTLINIASCILPVKGRKFLYRNLFRKVYTKRYL